MSNEKPLTTPKEKLDGRSFTFETMACVLAVLDSKGATLGGKAYDLMAQLDGKRTTAAFQHQFRAVKIRAKELASQLDDGAAVPRKRKGVKPFTPAPNKKRNKTDSAGDDREEVPTQNIQPKKAKVENEPSVEAPMGLGFEFDKHENPYGYNGGFFENANGPF